MRPIAKIRPDLLALLISMLLSSLGTSIVNIAIPSLVRHFRVTLPDAQWIVFSYLLSNSALIVLVGAVSARVSLKKLYLFGLGVFSAASFLAPFAPGLWALAALRAMQGLGGAVLMSLSVVLLSEFAPKENLGRYMGLVGTMSAVGTAAGPSVGGVLLGLFGWKSLFWLMGLLGAGTYLLFGLYYKKTAPAHPNGRETRGPGGAHLFAAALRPAGVKTQLLLNFLVAMIVMTTLVVGPFFLAQGQNLSYSATGLVMSVSPLISIFSGYWSGTFVQRLGSTRALRAALGLIFLGALAYVFLCAAFGAAGYILAALILSPGYQLFQAANNTILMTDTAAERKGLISSLNSLARNLGLVGGASLTGAVFSRGVGAEVSSASAAAIQQGTTAAFTLAAALAAAALLIAFHHFGRFSPKPSSRVFRPNSNSSARPG